MQRIHKAAADTVRQIDLGHIAGHNHLGTYTHTGQKHLHLLRCSVLRLIQDDKGIIQRAAAHIRQRSNLNDLLFHQALIGLSTQHIEQAIVERAQVRVYLLLQITGQKTQLLACFHGGTGQHNAGNILGLERFDRHCNGQIGLAGTGGTNAKGHSILADSIQIFLLAQCLGADGAALDCDRDKILSQLPDTLLLSIVSKAQAVAHRLILQRRVVFDQEQHPLHGTHSSGHVGLLAREAKHRTPADCRDRELLFQ